MTIQVNNQNVGEVVVNGSWTIGFSIKAEQGSKDVKTGTLKFNFQSVPLESIIQSSLKDKRINWQVGARTKFETLVDGSVVEITYGNATRVTVDPEVAMMNRLAAMTPEARDKWFADARAKASK